MRPKVKILRRRMNVVKYFCSSDGHCMMHPHILINKKCKFKKFAFSTFWLMRDISTWLSKIVSIPPTLISLHKSQTIPGQLFFSVKTISN